LSRLDSEALSAGARRENNTQNRKNAEIAPVTVRVNALPIEDWGSLPFKVRTRHSESRSQSQTECLHRYIFM